MIDSGKLFTLVANNDAGKTIFFRFILYLIWCRAMILAEVGRIFKMLLVLRCKKFARASQFRKRLAIRILVAFMGVYLLLNLLAFAYFLPFILRKANSDADIPSLVNGYILHVFLVLLGMRYFMQKMPAAQLQVFLPLPVRKSRLVLAYFGLLGLHPFNYVPIILALPLWLQTILPVYPALFSLFWLASILLLSWASAALLLVVKIFTFDWPFLSAIFFLTLSGLFLMDRLPILAVLPALSSTLFGSLLVGKWLTLFAVAAATALLVMLSLRILRSKLYLLD